MIEDPSDIVRKIRSIADYQFGRGIGEVLFPENVTVAFSKRTGRVRRIYFNQNLLATLRPSDGLFSLTIEGAERIMKNAEHKNLWVQVREDVSQFIGDGGNVFAKHVIRVDEEIRPGEEVIVIDGEKRVIAVGKALLSGDEMKSFRRGMAVKVRRGASERFKKREREE